MNKILSLIAASVCLFGCAQETLDEQLNSESKSQVLYANLVSDASSRVCLNEDGSKVIWQTDDAFRVFNANNDFDGFVLSTGEGQAKAEFVSQGAGVNEPTYAVFPLSMNPRNVGEQFFIDLPLKYGKNESQNAPMVGTISGKMIQFHQIAALLKIDFSLVPAEYSFIRIDGGSQSLAGKCTISSVEKDPILVGNNYSTTKKVTIEKGENAVFYLPLPAGIYKNLKIEAIGQDGENAKFVLAEAANKTVEKGKIYTLKSGDLEFAGGTETEYKDFINAQADSKKPLVVNFTGNFTEAHLEDKYLYPMTLKMNTPLTQSTLYVNSESRALDFSMPFSDAGKKNRCKLGNTCGDVVITGGSYNNLDFGFPKEDAAQHNIKIADGVYFNYLGVPGNTQLTIGNVQAEKNFQITCSDGGADLNIKMAGYTIKELRKFDNKGKVTVKLRNTLADKDVFTLYNAAKLVTNKIVITDDNNNTVTVEAKKAVSNIGGKTAEMVKE